MDEEKVAYLQMVLEPIGRMSTNSAIYKGFAATMVAGISMLALDEINMVVLGLSFLPIVAFAALDTYYLMLERKFRFLYEQIRKGEHPIDFSLKLTNDPLELIAGRARCWDCLKSPSIIGFYPLLFAIFIGVLCVKIWG